MGVRRGKLGLRGGVGRSEGVRREGVEIERKGSRAGGGCVSYSLADGAWSVFFSLKFVVSLSINQPLPSLSANPGSELPIATDLSFP